MHVASSATLVTQRSPDGRSGWTDYCGQYRELVRFQELLDRPQAFLVETLTPNSRIPPHFHTVDQFQVLLCSGRFAKEEFQPVAAHYAGPYTTYGPVIGNEEGLTFFTLRRSGTVGAYMMPESRDVRPRIAPRNRFCQVPAWQAPPPS